MGFLYITIDSPTLPEEEKTEYKPNPNCFDDFIHVTFTFSVTLGFFAPCVYGQGIAADLLKLKWIQRYHVVYPPLISISSMMSFTSVLLGKSCFLSIPY